MGDLTTLARADGTPIAARIREGRGPAILFLPGYASDMAGGKATALDAWAAETGRAFARFDYAGTGESGGRFEEQTLGDWLDDVLMLLDGLEGEAILVGSSMGGWLMLLAALARPEKVHALVGIAAAPDFTDWGFDDAQKAAFVAHGRVEEPSPYGPPLVTSRTFWESGAAHRLLGRPIAIDRPVRLLHGAEDRDVPIAIADRLAADLAGGDVTLTIVPGGDHRLSRPQDIALLIETVAALAR